METHTNETHDAWWGRAQGEFIINKKSYTHTCPLATENCSVVTDPVVGSGVPYSPTTSSAVQVSHRGAVYRTWASLRDQIKQSETLRQEIVHCSRRTWLGVRPNTHICGIWVKCLLVWRIWGGRVSGKCVEQIRRINHTVQLQSGEKRQELRGVKQLINKLNHIINEKWYDKSWGTLLWLPLWEPLIYNAEGLLYKSDIRWYYFDGFCLWIPLQSGIRKNAHQVWVKCRLLSVGTHWSGTWRCVKMHFSAQYRKCGFWDRPLVYRTSSLQQTWLDRPEPRL